jgi:galactose oxidase-like protein
MSRSLALVLLLAACGPRPELTLAIRVADDPSQLLATVTRLDLIATRDTQVLAQASYSTPTSYISVAGVAHGPHTVVTLEGFSAAGDLRAVGKTCAIDFEHSGITAPLYFAPTNFFAKTGGPTVTRADPIVVPLDDGSVLLAGGVAASGTLDSVERYFPGSASFAAGNMTLSVARAESETVLRPGFGALVTGGIDSSGQPLAGAEIYDAALNQFTPLSNLEARIEHRAVLLPDGRVFISGGRSSLTTLASTAFVRLSPTSMQVLQVLAGPPLATARRDHAVAVASGVPVLFGGYAVDGSPLASIETLFPDGSLGTIGALEFARAEATASLLLDGQILVVGGARDSAGTPRSDGELFNPLTRTTTVYPMNYARRGHTATVLPDGRVLIIGGLDANGQPLRSGSDNRGPVELFVPGVGFVLERPLNVPRAHHVAVPLCDGTVLVVGGADGAELYTPPPT